MTADFPRAANQHMVFLHGWGSGAAVWDSMAATLGGSARCTAPNLPGYGDQPHDAWQLVQLADGVAQQSPGRCVVVAWSLGALIALQWAVTRPRQVANLVLISATPRFTNGNGWVSGMDTAVFDQFAASVRTDPHAAMTRFISLQTAGDCNAGAVARRLRRLALAGAAERVHTLSEGLQVLRSADVRALLPLVTQPTLVVHGENDALVPLAAAQCVAAGVVHGSLAVVPRTGHAPFLSAPDTVSSLICEHVDE